MRYDNIATTLNSEASDDLEKVYEAGLMYLKHIEESVLDEEVLLMEYRHLFNDEWYRFITTHYDTLSSHIDKERTKSYQYSSLRDIVRNYLLKNNDGKVIEDVQWMWMRVAVQVGMPNLRDVIDTYHALSKSDLIHATPTCINAGRIGYNGKPQLESCFCVAVDDSMYSIKQSIGIFLMGSKCNGGFGIDLGRIRHSQIGGRGSSKGIPGLLSMFNTVIPYGNQLGSRSGACTFFCPIHHVDIETFITMKDRNAPINAINLNYCVVIPDLFISRMRNGGTWCLFDPRHEKVLWTRMNGGDVNDTREVDRSPCLHDLWGEKFEEFYRQCEESDIPRTYVEPSKLWDSICSMRCRFGSPFLFFKDNVNRKSAHSHIGTITQSNLCQEIVQYTKPDEIGATCDLATINLESLYEEKGVNYEKLGTLTRLLVRNLNRVVDMTSGIEDDDTTDTGRYEHRAVGIGAMGYSSLLSLMGVPYGSSYGRDIGVVIRACMYYHALDESCRLAEKDGPCRSWYGSPLSKGILHHDLYRMECEKMGRPIYEEIDPSMFSVSGTWDDLRERCKKGVRNSLLTCQMPNSTTSMVFGVTPGFEPYFDTLYAATNAGGSSLCMYNAFKKVMVRYGLYNPRLLGPHLKKYDGRLIHLDEIFPSIDKKVLSHIESLFTNGFSLNKRKMLSLYMRMGVYVDQAQSTNIYYDYPNKEYLSTLQLEAYDRGCKTLYYCYRKTVSKIALHKREVTMCTADCRSCQ